MTTISTAELREIVEDFVTQNPDANDEEASEAVAQFMDENELEVDEDEVQGDNDASELITEIVAAALADRPDDFYTKFDQAVKNLITPTVGARRDEIQNEFMGIESPEISEEELTAAETELAEAVDEFVEFAKENAIEDPDEAFAAFVEANELDEDDTEALANYIEYIAEQPDEEAIDELSRKTLGSYTQNAHDDVRDKREDRDDINTRVNTGQIPKWKTRGTRNRLNRQIRNREQGISRAIGKLSKEETQD